MLWVHALNSAIRKRLFESTTTKISLFVANFLFLFVTFTSGSSDRVCYRHCEYSVPVLYFTQCTSLGKAVAWTCRMWGGGSVSFWVSLCGDKIADVSFLAALGALLVSGVIPAFPCLSIPLSLSPCGWRLTVYGPPKTAQLNPQIGPLHSILWHFETHFQMLA